MKWSIATKPQYNSDKQNVQLTGVKSTFSQFTGHCEFTEGRIIYLQLPPTADWSLIQCQLDYSFINHPITCTCALLINSFFQPVLLRFSQLLKATITFNSLNIIEYAKVKLCLWSSFINLQIQVGLHHHYNLFLFTLVMFVMTQL